MESYLIFLCVLVIAVQTYGEPASLGFINIDCGISSGYPYTDELTNITYNSDHGYINTGENHIISPDSVKFAYRRQSLNLKSFPTGGRNCYTINSTLQGNKYLVRASFMHGDYDGSASMELGVSVIFDLYIGVNFWETVNITNTSFPFYSEIIHIAIVDSISVCLLNTKQGTPFISSLEVRPLKRSIYPAAMANQSLSMFTRVNLGVTEPIRYPIDPYDRLWFWNNFESMDRISTTSQIGNIVNDLFQVPSAVMQSAVTPRDNETSLAFYWNAELLPTTPEYFIMLYFSDFQNVQIREFDIYINDMLLNSNNESYSPPFLVADSVYSTGTLSIARRGSYNLSLNAAKNSQLPPILNAVEIYSVKLMNQPSTVPVDVNAMMAIKAEYQVEKNWMGDPCLPEDYTWLGVKCSQDGDISTVISLDLSHSDLHGAISDKFSLLKSLQHLNLSYNNLNGSVPESLTNLSSLHALDLSGNRFSGKIPEALCTKRSLNLRYDTADGLCDGKVPNKKNRVVLIVSIVVPVVAVGLLSAIVIFCFCRKTPNQMTPEDCQDISRGTQAVIPDSPSHEDIKGSREFTYDELVQITNNFSVCIGEGGFGRVYRGQLNDGTQVAVKMLSQAPLHGQGQKEFFAEVASLRKVHHRYLVLLVGCCTNKDHLALVYEYMSNGSLFDCLRGKRAAVRNTSWRERAQIAYEAAQGLDYLHRGCVLPIIHRDVKSQNILLGQDMHAKISDFGLSQSYISPAQTHISVTAAAGTTGYIDPEHYMGGRLTESSDVYSFGVVLLEVVTGEPPILPAIGHIAQRVKHRISGGDVAAVIDPRLHGAYDVNSVWKVVDIALQCTAEESCDRPAMAAVVAQLKDAVALEEFRESGATNNDVSAGSNAGQMSTNWGPGPR